MGLSPEILDKIERLQKKYAASGQDMSSYLEGLIHSNYLTYWDYIHLDVLLNLQTPKTNFPDEEIFIMYHQITELYFKMCLHAIAQVTEVEDLTKEEFIKQVTRVNDYFENLIRSFQVMVDGMDKEQFLAFRMALLPASGFQSAQYRFIEIYSSDAYNLVSVMRRGDVARDSSIKELYEHFYWKEGGIELSSGQKTLTLRQFEEKYSKQFLELIRKYQHKNIWQKYKALPQEDQEDQELIDVLRQMDVNIEVRWPLMHYKSAVRYLQQDPVDIAATGGTNWQKYLPPRFQHIFLFPDLLTEEEREMWGRQSQGVK